MMWQMWTAAGLMLGYVFGVAFWNAGQADCRALGMASSDVELPCVSI